MKKYFVISYDSNDQIPILDCIIVTEDVKYPREEAMAIMDRLYPDQCAAAAFTSEELRKHADDLEAATKLPFWESVKDLTRDRCVELLESISIECRDNESDAELTEAVRSNIEDGELSIDDIDD